jgi:ABC-type phosphate transport system auxiliary subunit
MDSLLFLIFVVVVILVIAGIGFSAFWDAIVKGWNRLFQEAEGTREFSKSLQALTASMPSHNE